jgi:hypothetical protein
MAGTYTTRASPMPSSVWDTITEPSADASLPVMVVVQLYAGDETPSIITMVVKNIMFFTVTPLW